MSPVQTSGAATSAAATATSLSSLQQLLTQLTRTNVSGSMTAINPAIQSMLASTLGRMGNITALGKPRPLILILRSSIHLLLDQLILSIATCLHDVNFSIFFEIQIDAID